jgi:outer membrane protein
MKKIILSALAVCAFTFVSAQDKKSDGAGFSSGDVFVTGGVAITSSNDKNTDTKDSGFGLTPKVGYFLTENIALGAKVGFMSAKTTVAGATTMDDSGVMFGAFGRYYFSPASQFSVFTELGFDYTTMKDKITSVKENTMGVGLSLGLNYFVSNHFALEASYAGLSIESSKFDVPGAKNTSSFGLGADLSAVSIGLLYKF